MSDELNLSRLRKRMQSNLPKGATQQDNNINKLPTHHGHTTYT